MKFTSEDFKNYTDWQKYILHTHPEIPAECRRPTLIAFCLVLASHGSAGLDCYASDVTLAKELGISRRFLPKYRQLAIELGWFVPNGEQKYRVQHLDISVPAYQLDVPELDCRTKPEPKPVYSHVNKPCKADVMDEDDPWYTPEVA